MASAEVAECALRWLNGCGVLGGVLDFDALRDGYAFAKVLHHFVPEQFGPPSQSDSVEERLARVCRGLESISEGLEELQRAQQKRHCVPIEEMLEAVLLACVQGSNAGEVVQGILALDSGSQMIIMRLIQDHEDGTRTTPRQRMQMKDTAQEHGRQITSSAKSQQLQEQLSYLQSKLHVEVQAVHDALAHQRDVAEQLRRARQRCESEQEAIADARFDAQSGIGVERTRRHSLQLLQDEVDEAVRCTIDLPEREKRIQAEIEVEQREIARVDKRNLVLEQEVAEICASLQAPEVKEGQGDALLLEVADEQKKVRFLEEQLDEAHEVQDEEAHIAVQLWETYQEQLHMEQQLCEEATYYHRLAVYEKGSEDDVKGVLEFSKMELKQLEESAYQKASINADQGKLRSELRELREEYEKAESRVDHQVVMEHTRCEAAIQRLRSDEKRYCSEMRSLESVTHSLHDGLADISVSEDALRTAKAKLDSEEARLHSLETEMARANEDTKELVSELQSRAGALRARTIDAKDRQARYSDRLREAEVSCAVSAVQAEVARKRADEMRGKLAEVAQSTVEVIVQRNKELAVGAEEAFAERAIAVKQEQLAVASAKDSKELAEVVEAAAAEEVALSTVMAEVEAVKGEAADHAARVVAMEETARAKEVDMERGLGVAQKSLSAEEAALANVSAKVATSEKELAAVRRELSKQRQMSEALSQRVATSDAITLARVAEAVGLTTAVEARRSARAVAEHEAALVGAELAAEKASLAALAQVSEAVGLCAGGVPTYAIDSRRSSKSRTKASSRAPSEETMRSTSSLTFTMPPKSSPKTGSRDKLRTQRETTDRGSASSAARGASEKGSGLGELQEELASKAREAAVLHEQLLREDKRIQELRLFLERRQASMRGELQLLTCAMHEVGLRYAQLANRHRLLKVDIAEAGISSQGPRSRRSSDGSAASASEEPKSKPVRRL